MLTEEAYRGRARRIELGADLDLNVRGWRWIDVVAATTGLALNLPPTVDLLGDRFYPLEMSGKDLFVLRVYGNPVAIKDAGGVTLATVAVNETARIHLQDPYSESWKVTIVPTLGASTASELMVEQGIIVGGTASSTLTLIYDPVLQTFNSFGIPAMPRARTHSALTSLRGGGIIAAGAASAGAAAMKVDRYDGAAWSALPDLPIEMVRPTAATLFGVPYVIAGTNTGRVFRAKPRFAGWEEVGEMPLPRGDIAAVAVVDRIIVLGGSPEEAQGVEYVPEHGMWREITPFPGNDRKEFCAFAYRSQVYVCGGVDWAGNVLDEVWIYDPITRVWAQGPALPQGPRQQATAFVARGIPVVAGGRDATGTPTADVVRLIGGVWQSGLNPLPSASADFANQGGSFIA